MQLTLALGPAGADEVDGEDCAALKKRTRFAQKDRNLSTFDPHIDIGRCLADDRRNEADESAELNLDFVLQPLCGQNQPRENGAGPSGRIASVTRRGLGVDDDH